MSTDTDEYQSARDKWIARLSDEDKAHKQFRELAKKANDEYFAVALPNNEALTSTVAYPLFWSIVNVLHGRIYSQPPTPDVRKRFQDEPAQQPVGPLPPGAGLSAAAGPPPGPPAGAGPVSPGAPQPGQPPAPMGAGLGAPLPQPVPPAPAPTVDDNRIALTLERAISYIIDTTNFDADGHAAVNDLLVAGLGVAKVEIDTETQDIPIADPSTGQPLPELDADGEPKRDKDGGYIPAMQTVITDQTIRLRHFGWNQFRWEPQQHWSQVSWVGFDHWMTKDEIEDTWGVRMEVASASSRIGGGGSGLDEKKPQSDKYMRLFKVTEIWNRADKTVLYVCEQHNEALEIRDDPLGLKDFFPCPKPMMLNIRGEDLVPQPDYSKCEGLFRTANTLYSRIDSLTRQVKDVGFYDAAFPELAALTTADDGSLVPIANILKRFNDINPAALGGGYDAIVFKQDNAPKVSTVQVLQQILDDCENKIWKSYGVSDIQRGSTNPNETATAQNIKNQWADIRVGQRIRLVALFFRDVFRIMADILSTFKPEVLQKMTGIALTPDELQIMASDITRSYAVDVESDSTVVQDEYADQQQRMGMLESVTKYLQTLGPAAAQGQIPADLFKELLLVAVNSFKVGRQIEDAINSLPGTMQQLSGLQKQVQQGQGQLKQMQDQAQAQAKQIAGFNAQKEARESMKAQVDAGKTQADTEHTEIQTALDAQQLSHQAMQPHPSVVPFPPRGIA